GHSGQDGQAAGPLEHRRDRVSGGHRVAELDVVVHARAEGLVARVAAPAQGVVLARCAGGPGNRDAFPVDELDRAGDPVGAVVAYLDGRGPGVAPVDLVAGLDAVDGVAEGPGRTV